MHAAPPPSPAEDYCAWYGEAREGVLYFGQAAFWSAMRGAGGDPRADLARAGPQPIGRFALPRSSARPGRLLPAIEVASAGRSGVWDVLPRPDGEICFTTFFESAGCVDPRSGRVRRFEPLGRGLNELAAGPDGTLIASRYGSDREPGASGSVVVFTQDGRLIAEHPLAAPTGFVTAPKTVAWEPARGGHGGRLWLSSDLVRRDAGAPAPASLHPAIVLDDRGREIARIEAVELHFVRFAAGAPASPPQAAQPPRRGLRVQPGRAAVGHAAFTAGRELRLVELDAGPPGPQLRPGAGRLLDADFPAALDFVQDLAYGPAGEVIATRWSGRVHVLERDGRLRSLQLPMPRRGSALYYSAAIGGGTLCATRCGIGTEADVAVVCAPLR